VLVNLIAVSLSFGGAQVFRFLSHSAGPPQDGQTFATDSQHIRVGLASTTNGGASWIERKPPANGARDFLDIPAAAQPAYFKNDRLGWLSGVDSVWNTTDGGLTWSRMLDGHLHAVSFGDKHAGWMGVGDGRSVRNYVTRDSGYTWSECGEEWQLTTVAPMSSAFFLNDNTGWVTVASYDDLERPVRTGVARTDDGGCKWKTIWWNLNRNQDILGTLNFVDTEFGWLSAAGYGKLRQTSDGGITWQDVPLPARYFEIRSSILVDHTHGWVLGDFSDMAGTLSGIFYTSDRGQHWLPVPQSDLRLNRNLARQLPASWSDGLLVRALTIHEKVRAR
jgi:photosystem II stability/assembly factor-like uncharacterized protein